jgi:glycosyltransferase involved in cell wall biosynthesis
MIPASSITLIPDCQTTMKKSVSIILPAKNESIGLENLLQEIRQQCPDAELVLVNDCSTDDTAVIAGKIADKVVTHPYSMGNGAAIKNGARAASGDTLVFMDADGQHTPSDITRLLEVFEKGFEMVIGARKPSTHASLFRRFANNFYNKLASVMTGVKIEDLTSGFRVINAKKFRQYLYLLPNGFSYPTTITMAFLRSGYPITYLPIEARQRVGKSNIHLIKDGMRFLLIILKIGSLFSPLRMFLPISMALFLTSFIYYGYTYITFHRLTNMSVILLLAALLIFLIGIIAEQISSLHYQSADRSEIPQSSKRNPDR